MNASRTNIAALAAATLATSMTFIDATAINQALPAIGEALEASTAQLIWTVGAYALPLALLLLPAGVLADRCGRRRVLASGMVVFAIASAACAAAPGASWLIAARAVQGLGGAMIVPASLAVLTGAHAPQQRGRVIGAWSAWCAAATIAGPLLGGVLAQAAAWRGIFLLNLPLTVVALWCLRAVPTVRATAGRSGSDAPGPGITRFAASLWRRPVMRAAAGSTLALYAGMYGLLLVLPLALIAGAGYRADHAAAAQLPLLMLLICACPLAGRWVDRCGPRAPVCAGCVLAASGLVWLIVGGFGDAPTDYLARLLVPLSLLGAGLGLAIVPLSTTVMNGAGDEALGAGGALNALLARCAAAVAVGVFGGLLLGRGLDLTGASHAAAAAWPATFRAAMVLAALLCAVTAALAACCLPGNMYPAFARRPAALEARS